MKVFCHNFDVKTGAVQASDPPPMPRLSLVKQVKGEGRSHSRGNYRTGIMRLALSIRVCWTSLLQVLPKKYLTHFFPVQRSELPCDLNGADRQRSEAVSKSTGDQCMGRCCPGIFLVNKCIKQTNKQTIKRNT